VILLSLLILLMPVLAQDETVTPEPTPAFGSVSGFIQSAVTGLTEEKPPEAVSASDQLANNLAIVVLVALAVSIALVIGAGAARMRGIVPAWLLPLSRWMTFLALFSGAGLALTLALGGNADRREGLLAGVAALLLVAGAVIIVIHRRQPEGLLYHPAWLMPLILAAGLIVAGYLTYVEMGAHEAVCGLVGDCNAVQQSDYARLFGVVPVGAVGLAGYAALLLAWLWGKITGARLASVFLLLFAEIGVVFSAYLTFLEPFVIGATCMWCLTSAVTMLALLWLIAPEGLAAITTRG